MITILCDDCTNWLKRQPRASIDCVITDCPYHIISGGCSTGVYGNDPSGVLNHHRERTDENVEFTRQGKLFKHNDIKFSEWLPDVYRVLKDGTHCYIMVNPRNLKDLQVSAENAGFKFQQLIVWRKQNSTPNRYYLNSYELILMLRKGRARNINNMGTKNILEVPNIIGKKGHPTEKPVELMKILVENSTNKGDIVLDPFMGSGATGVACKDLGRKFVGIEIDEKYFKMAVERLNV